MRRNTRRHADGDTLGAVDEQVRNPHRKYLRLLLRLIKIRTKIHHILIQIRQIHILGKLLQLRLRVTHGGGAVSLDGTKVSVAVHQRHPLLKLLLHDHQRFIDGAVSVGMIFTHGITHDSRGLSVRPVRPQPQLFHGVEHSPLHRLQTVSHIRQRSLTDDAHGIIDI